MSWELLVGAFLGALLACALGEVLWRCFLAFVTAFFRPSKEEVMLHNDLFDARAELRLWRRGEYEAAKASAERQCGFKFPVDARETEN